MIRTLGHRKGAPAWVALPVDCSICGNTTNVAVSRSSLKLWQSGTLIQEAMPYLTVEERETLISSLCPPCQNYTLSEEEE